MKLIRPHTLLASLLLTGSLFAANPPAAAPDPAAELAARTKFASSLHYQTGTISLHDGLAKLALPAGYRYLGPADSETLLTKVWGNPNGSGTLGMIMPGDFDPLAGESWAVVVTFTEDGYVKDDEAAKINYGDLLKQMKEGTHEANEERVKAGYPAVELVGWATPPRYDAASHKLYWAKEIKFGDEADHTLNYNIRMLGRRGVLVLNAIATMGQLKQVEAAAPTLLTMIDFQEGHRYADYKDGTDKVATYGIAALVAGGIAAKAGFFKLLWVGILAFKKVIILGVIALGSQFKKLWAWIRGRNTAVPATPEVAGGGPPANLT